MLRSLILVAMFLLSGLALTLHAQEIDGQVNLGDTFQGTVQGGTDVDIVVFDAVAGDFVTVTVGPGKGSTLKPHVEVRDAATDAVVGGATAVSKSVKLVVTIPGTGSYEVRVSGADGTTGSFKAKTSGKPSKAALKPASAPGSGAPGSVQVSFDAPAGTLFSATVQPGKKSDALPGAPTLMHGSDSVDLLPYSKTKGSKITIKSALLPALGHYVFSIDNVGGPGEVTAKVSLKRPKLKKKVVIESHFAFVLDDSISLQTTTSSMSFALLGKIVDLTGEGLPPSVEWTRSGGGSTAGGSIKLKAGVFSGSVPLQPGDNMIALQANNVSSGLVIAVTYNPGYDFGGHLVLTPDVVYVNESKTVTAQIALTDGSTDATGVKLVRLDGSDEVFVTSLVDDGNLSAGDDIQGDRIYSGKSSILIGSEGTTRFRVVVAESGGGEARSETFDLLVTQHLGNTELNSILALQESKQGTLDAAAAGGTLDQALDTVLAELLADPLVAQAGKNEGGTGLWIMYETGVAGVLYGPTSAVKGGALGAAVAAAPVLPVQPQAGVPATSGPPHVPPFADARRASMNAALLDQRKWQGGTSSSAPYDAWLVPSEAPGADLPPEALSATAPNAVKSNKARVIAAQFFSWGNSDDIPAMAQKLIDDGCFDVNYTKYTSSGTGSVEDFKQLGNYGVVLISSHGDSFYNGLLSLYKDKFGWNGPFGQVILHSNMKVTTANKVTYEDDLKKGRLVLWYGNYGITPTFIGRYNGTMPNSLIYMSICRGTFNGTMAQAFLSKGAGTYLGYSDYVAVSFCQSIGPPLLDTLLMSDKSMKDAFVPGKKETDTDPAEFRLFGADDLSLNAGKLNDGDFEAANINQAWTTEGDARVIPFLGEFSPTEGNWMGIISTGLGFTTDSGSLHQTVCLSPNAKTVSFDWNFISEEFVEYCGSIYQDYFTVTLEDTVSGNKVTLLSTYVDLLCDQVNPVSFSFDQGDAYATGWKSFSIAIPPEMQGHKVELTLAASDVGDSIYDTAILLDGIKVSE